jgi:hypothetical protein
MTRSDDTGQDEPRRYLRQLQNVDQYIEALQSLLESFWMYRAPNGDTHGTLTIW